ncbi:hypothetical protein JR316_0009276 [Psilocybe cubensis]|uniref:Uncharacterized protein n=1 Tax=Psilocybe cubensis TaxID=181762 RepID=A0ACB8GTM7_PSICU|nr:hypothetical protein JR316_0009276 [Psilocybe cubensis]KAH9478814.1 hypothetical protein JR316_0009276 [Psilocybe cubensis]
MHLAILELHWGSHHVLSIAEFDWLPYKIPSLDHTSFSGVDKNNNPIPTKHFIMSPNMPEIPDIRRNSHDVTIREDGRYGYANFTLCP